MENELEDFMDELAKIIDLLVNLVKVLGDSHSAVLAEVIEEKAGNLHEDMEKHSRQAVVRGMWFSPGQHGVRRRCRRANCSGCCNMCSIQAVRTPSPP